MNILITGGAGFIGTHTADALIAAGHRVRVLDTLDPQIHGAKRAWPTCLSPEVEKVQGDVCDLTTVTHALDEVEAVYHLAALTGVGQSLYDIRSYVEINCAGTATLLEAIVKSKRPITRLVLSSSRAVYGEGTHSCELHGPCFPPLRSRGDLERGRFDIYCAECGAPLRSVPTQEDKPLAPLSVYAYTKKHQEELCRYASSTYGIPLTILRYFNVYGSRQSLQNPYTGVVSIFYSRLRAGQPISLYEAGKPLRDFIHVLDVARANVLAIDPGLPFADCFNVGSGVEVPLRTLAETLMHAVACHSPLLDRGEYRVGDIHACCAELSHARAVLGFRPSMGLVEGMQEFATWARNQSSIDHYATAVAELDRHKLFGRARHPGPEEQTQ